MALSYLALWQLPAPALSCPEASARAAGAAREDVADRIDRDGEPRLLAPFDEQIAALLVEIGQRQAADAALLELKRLRGADEPGRELAQPRLVADERDEAGRTHYDRAREYYRTHDVTDYDESLYYDSRRDRLPRARAVVAPDELEEARHDDETFDAVAMVMGGLCTEPEPVMRNDAMTVPDSVGFTRSSFS